MQKKFISKNINHKYANLWDSCCDCSFYYNIDVPGYIENTTFLLTYSTIFLVLMSLGIALTKLKIISWMKSVTLSSVRVILGPIIGLIFIKLFNLKGYAAGVLFIQASMPNVQF